MLHGAGSEAEMIENFISLERRKAWQPAIVIDYGIKIKINFVVFDKMLVVLISAIFSYKSPFVHCVLEVFL